MSDKTWETKCYLHFEGQGSRSYAKCTVVHGISQTSESRKNQSVITLKIDRAPFSNMHVFVFPVRRRCLPSCIKLNIHC